jgi:hypothetical protein
MENKKFNSPEDFRRYVDYQEYLMKALGDETSNEVDDEKKDIPQTQVDTIGK